MNNSSNQYQLVGLSLAATLCLAACGGGGSSSPPTITPSGNPDGSTTALAVSNPSLVTTTPVAGSVVQFAGGVCSGGKGALTAAWTFGDGSATSTSGSHTYASAGTYLVWVGCVDAGTGATKTTSSLSVKVAAAPVNKTGFLASTWSSAKTIDPSNTAIYPVAAMGNDGVVQGLWLQNSALAASTVGSGQIATNPLATSWTINPVFDLGGATSAYNNYLHRTFPAPMDMALSPDGHGFAAWIAGTYLWYTTKTSSTSWATPTKLTIKPAADAVKVVVSNTGDAAIAYCDASGAQVVTYSATGGIKLTPQQISTTCINQIGSMSIGEQIIRGFDLAIDNATSKVQAVGYMPSTSVTGNVLIAKRTYDSATGWSAAVAVSEDLPKAKLPGTSISMSLSPNGLNEAVAWSGTGSGGLSNAFARITIAGVQGAILPLQSNNSVAYSTPYIAVNDGGYAFAVMSSDTTPYMVNYQPSKGWMTTPKRVASYSGYSGIDVAIDKFGNGLVTLNDAEIQSLAVTLSADGLTSAGQTVFSGYGYGDYHYQTLRALPDGRAILVVSTYPSSGYLASSYTVLK